MTVILFEGTKVINDSNSLLDILPRLTCVTLSNHK